MRHRSVTFLLLLYANICCCGVAEAENVGFPLPVVKRRVLCRSGVGCALKFYFFQSHISDYSYRVIVCSVRVERKVQR